ncbi:site-specific integrase [Lactiplantibacillus plantarum]|uniref:site-specific integrase n=1 Tax=Lactiplantibacillus plantarum TaxID=1590 RepID=UPI0021A766C4|nr:site-specific integrase [Lactiplantibacillus plantarum]MCT3248133.1 site-specific integrase [Lactiplantibacillus plantarum]
MAIKQYKKTDGTSAWKFNAYLGVDPLTGKETRTNRQGFHTKKEAQLELARLKLEFDEHGKQKRDNSTYKAVYELWTVEYKATVAESTYVKTTGYFKHHILPAFGNYRIEKITMDYCQQIINGWFKQFKKYQTIMNYASLVFKYAIKHGLIERNPVDLITYPRHKELVKTDEWENFFDKNELKAFLSALDSEDKKQGNYKADTLFRVLAFTGMRKGEALALTWDKIDFQQGTITINQALSRGEDARLYVKPPKTKNSNRVIDIDNNTIRVLKQWQIRQRQELFMLGYNVNDNKQPQLVFCNTKNSYLPPSRLRTWLVRILNKYHLKYITVHGFRHTHASLLFEAGASLKQVQERLGHSDISTTMNVYAHVSKHAKKDTVNKLVKYLDL